MRIIVEFTKQGAAAQMSHLDLQRTVQRALRRSGLPLQYSQGFNPHAVLAFATALPVGMSSVCELMDFTAGCGPEEALARLDPALPPGMRALRARAVSERFPALMATAAEQDVRIVPLQGEALCAQVAPFLAQAQCLVKKTGKNGVKDLDIRPRVLALSAQEGSLLARLSCAQENTLRPDLLVAALSSLAGINPAPFQAERVGLYGKAAAGAVVPLFQLPDPGEAP